jgi:hypothetical protein
MILTAIDRDGTRRVESAPQYQFRCSIIDGSEAVAFNVEPVCVRIYGAYCARKKDSRWFAAIEIESPGSLVRRDIYLMGNRVNDDFPQNSADVPRPYDGVCGNVNGRNQIVPSTALRSDIQPAIPVERRNSGTTWDPTGHSTENTAEGIIYVHRACVDRRIQPFCRWIDVSAGSRTQWGSGPERTDDGVRIRVDHIHQHVRACATADKNQTVDRIHIDVPVIGSLKQDSSDDLLSITGTY